MGRTLINTLPVWYFLYLSMFLASTIVVIFAISVKKYFYSIVHKQHEIFIYTIIGIISTYYAFLMGFTIIVLWQAYTHATLITSNEASHLALVIEDSLSMPQAFQSQISQAVGKYIHFVVNEEWSLMKWGQVSTLANQAFNQIFEIMHSYAPQGIIEQTFYQEIVGNLNAALDNRTQRLNAVSSVLPDPLRFIMILGAIIIPCFLSLIEIKHRRVHIYTLIIMSSILGFNVGFAFTLDYPFSGTISVSSEPFLQGPLTRFKPH